MQTKGALILPINYEDGLEITELISEGDQLYALVKVSIHDLPNLKILKTDKNRRDYQKNAQKKYRKRLERHRKKPGKE